MLAQLLTGLESSRLGDLASRFSGMHAPAASVVEVETQAGKPARFMFKGAWLGERLLLLGEPCPDEILELRDRMARLRERFLEASRSLGRRTVEEKRLLAELDELGAQLEHFAHTDHMTDLPNRLNFIGALRHEWARSRRYGGCYSVLVVGLDRLDELVAAHGVAAGDAAVTMVAELLSTRLRQTDSMARYSTDEFGVLMCETEGKDACTVAARMCATVAAQKIPLNGEDYLTVTIGVSEATGEDEHPEQILHRASTGRNKALATGGNCCVLADSGMGNL